MATYKLDVQGETCPVPLVEFRKLVKRAESGDIIEIVGTHEASKKEIPMAIEALSLELLELKEENGIWKIKVKI